MVQKIAVLGSGTMGHGIAETFALSGFDVMLYDINMEILNNSLEKIRKSVEKIAAKTGIDAESVIQRVFISDKMEDFKDAEFLVEAVPEDISIKKEVIQKADSIIQNNCIFSSNTSTIPISELATLTGRQERFLGLHFFNPPVLMPLVEIIRGQNTSDSTVTITEEIVERIKKNPIHVNKDIPGFVVNRLNDRMITESMKMIDQGVRPEILDAALKFRMGLPMGICELLDYVGIDTVYLAGREMRSRGFGNSETPVLREMYDSKMFGIKTGSGFYSYSKKTGKSNKKILPDDEMYTVNILRIISVVVNEAAWLVENDISSVKDIDSAMKSGMNWPDGPFGLFESIGPGAVISMLQKMSEESTEYEPVSYLIKKKESIAIASDSAVREFGPVLYHESGEAARITMNRPDKLNALNIDMWKGLYDSLKTAAESSPVRTVILQSSGRAFSAGDDIQMMDNWKGRDAETWMKNYADPLVSLMIQYPKTLICAVNGIAAGGGCELTMLCDIVIATEDSVFSIPEGLIGAMPPLASTYGISFIDRRIMRYALTGEQFSSGKAHDMGLVDIVVPNEQLEYTIHEILGKSLLTAPLSSLAIKKVINGIRKGKAEGLESGKDELVNLALTEDFSEGQKAFRKRRKPKWRGK